MPGGRMQLVARAIRKPRRAPRVKKFKTVYRRKGAGLGRIPVLSAPRQVVRLRYGIGSVITSTAGSVGTYVFSANGLYDVNITGAGHQPRGFDQWMSMYDHYTVFFSKITLRVMNQTGTGNPVRLALRLGDGPTPPATTLDYRESRHVKTAYLNPTIGQRHLSLSCNVKRYLGASRLIGLSEFRGSSTSNPVEQAFYQVSAQDMSSGTQSLALAGQIDFWAVLTEPQLPPSS